MLCILLELYPEICIIYFIVFSMVVAMPFVCCQRLILLQFTAIHGVVDLLHLWFLKTVHKDRPVNVHHQDHSVHQGNKSSSMGKGFYCYFIITFTILGPSWLWWYGSWIYNYLCNQCLSPQVVSWNPVHGEVYSIQHYVIKFVSDLRQVSDFLQLLRFPSPIKLTTII